MSHVGDTALAACIPSLPISPWFERTMSREKKMRAERTIVRVDKLILSRSTHLQGPRVLLPNKQHVFLSVLLPQINMYPFLIGLVVGQRHDGNKRLYWRRDAESSYSGDTSRVLHASDV